MALEAPLRSSTGNLQFPFSYQGSMSAQSDNEGLRSNFRVVSSPPPATDSSSLRPSSAQRISSNSMHLLSPSDIVGPSPVTSNGTETTEIEDDASEEVHEAHSVDGSSVARSELHMLTTNIPDSLRHPSSEEAVSVIHAPESFATWLSSEPVSKQSQRSEQSSPKADMISTSNTAAQKTSVLPSRPLVSTDVKPVRYSVDSATPRAQDLQDMINDGSRLRSSSTSSLEKIEEQTENEADDDDDYLSQIIPQRLEQDEISALRTALQECWTLCNTLANLSSIHRARVFNSSGTPDAHEKAWKTCWKLCQRLYENQDEDPGSLNVRMNLDLCRDFCQALFDVRQKKDETADSVLRVSFELNNHLYSAQDSRNLPEVFRERTLDFYITLCHRLMKQRSDLAEETDQLLKSCWALAEMLFSLRQNRRDGKRADEELLGSAVQACWDLCDIFRDGWTQVRPDRNTPRPNQTTFFSHQPSDQTGRESRTSNRSSLHSKRESVKSSRQEERPRQPVHVPETPVTEFEDTPISPESRSPQMPNIMVLGTTTDNGRGGRWSSSASNLSSYSQSSQRTSSTATTATAAEDVNVTRSKILVLRAAMNLGFNRDAVTEPKMGSATLQKFVQGLSNGSFGTSLSHATLMNQYKQSVLSDGIVPRNHALPARGKRVSAHDMATSVMAMSKSSPRYVYLRELFKFVFQFPLEEVDSRRNVSIVV
ncbi:hypothetical protein S7711_08665 [Stachybotrys chartarum IBT 7711]|uniref:DUF7624 domain-containing protein n=1 Tax=Stachybotrys chartarum (strain CBS 109288 / IBT 7711) TaxID=1280523 RepID=A0A084AYU0_STACB|nr:hypothetical protein S7711_08665 [Stachybotrys chartarum IBT 7711]KFA49278.1 hypothetical protein S40293_07873 [Stachybotrys chartarum IBT 40293]KFA73076.1 hypothetical protein S40288_02756 [Stachybotrys chartarum IBT 40288]